MPPAPSRSSNPKKVTPHLKTVPVPQKINNSYFQSLHAATLAIEASHDDLKILQLNVRGISDIKKFGTFCTMLATFKFNFDVVLLTEIKVKANFPYQLYNIDGFNRFINLRDSKTGGGGVMIFVHKSISSEEIICKTNEIEKLKLNLLKDKKSFCLIAYYRAPRYDNEDEFLYDFESELASSEMKTIVIGDINLNSNSTSKAQTAKSKAEIFYQELIESYRFKVTNSHQTRCESGRTIDHVVTNFFEGIDNFTIEFDPAFSDHNMVLTIVRPPRKVRKDKNTIVRERINYKFMKATFPDIYNAVKYSDDSNFISEQLTTALKETVANSTTTKSFTLKHTENINQWTSTEAIELIIYKDKLLQRKRKKPTLELCQEIKSVDRKLKETNARDYKNYVQGRINTKDPKKMWRNLNAVLGRGKNFQDTFKIEMNGKLLTNPNDISASFNEFFSTCADEILKVTEPVLPSEVVVEVEPSRSMYLNPPSYNELNNIVSSLKNNSAAGYDGISTRVIKALRPKSIAVLVHLISVIFATGVFPDNLKVAVITPIHKSGSQKCVDNFRPISVLPVLSRIVEKALHRRLLIYMNRHLKLLYNHQFGFRPECSTENAAIEMINNISRTIDRGKVATGIFMDLKKAFDLVDHSILLKVLERYGVKNQELKLFQSYLRDRTQVVKIDKSIGTTRQIKTGIIQGSCLGPLLYLIFINAIGSLNLKGKLYLFADDAALINTHSKNDDIAATMCDDMNRILEFFKNRRMVLNDSKTNFMVFSSNKSFNFPNTVKLSDHLTILRVSNFKYLGLIINERLDWNDHLKLIERKLAPANGILWKLRKTLPLKFKKMIYDALFQSHINFMVPIWGLASNVTLNNAQVLQNRALRNVYDLPEQLNRGKMYAHYVESHLPIRACCLVGIATYMFNVINGKTHSNIDFHPAQSSHGQKLRNSKLLRPAPARTNYGTKSLETIRPSLYNKIPVDIRNSHHQHAFKWSLKCHLRNENFINACFTSNFLHLNF